VKRQAVTGLAARARLAEDRASHHFALAVDADAGRLLLLQLLGRRLRLQLAKRISWKSKHRAINGDYRNPDKEFWRINWF
jgi:hypothetical protein